MPNSYYKPSKTIVPTPDKKGTRKLQINIPGRHRCKILNKTLTRQIQKHVKMSTHCDHGELILRTQGWFNMCKSFHVIHHINKMKNKSHVIISIDAEKAFDKIQHPFMIKTFQKAGIEGTYLNIIGLPW